MAAKKTAGYSGTPLIAKLGIAEGAKVALVAAPEGFAESLDLPIGAKIVRGGAAKDIDVAILFVTERARLPGRFAELTARMTASGGAWIAWPKKASGVATDVTENAIREDLLPTGWVDNKVCAIDETWSGLRMVLRKALRPKKK